MASYPLGTYGDLLALAMDPALCRISVSDVLHSDITKLSGTINQKMLDKPRSAEVLTPMAVAASHTVGRSPGSAVFLTLQRRANHHRLIRPPKPRNPTL